jgi:hypothetical protein
MGWSLKTMFLQEKDVDALAEGKKLMIVVIWSQGCSACMSFKEKLESKGQWYEDNNFTMIEASNLSSPETWLTEYPTELVYSDGARRKSSQSEVLSIIQSRPPHR